MRSLDQPNISFIIRIWWEEEGADARGRRFWRGWVQHVRSGEETYVQDVEQLLNFMERWTGSLRKSESELKAKEVNRDAVSDHPDPHAGDLPH